MPCWYKRATVPYALRNRGQGEDAVAQRSYHGTTRPIHSTRRPVASETPTTTRGRFRSRHIRARRNFVNLCLRYHGVVLRTSGWQHEGCFASLGTDLHAPGSREQSYRVPALRVDWWACGSCVATAAGDGTQDEWPEEWPVGRGAAEFDRQRRRARTSVRPGHFKQPWCGTARTL